MIPYVRVALAVGMTLALGIFIYHFYYDPSEDYSPLEPPVQCLKIDNSPHTLCAQCIQRPSDILP